MRGLLATTIAVATLGGCATHRHHQAPVTHAPTRYALPAEAEDSDRFCVVAGPQLRCATVWEVRQWLTTRRYAGGADGRERIASH